MTNICLDCGKEKKIIKDGFCKDCLKKLSPMKSIKKSHSKVKIPEKEGKSKEWDPQKNLLWKPAKGNSICERCYTEKPKSELIRAEDLGYDICQECVQKRRKISHKANEYWKGKNQEKEG